jgi:hypothetical protein
VSHRTWLVWNHDSACVTGLLPRIPEYNNYLILKAFNRSKELNVNNFRIAPWQSFTTKNLFNLLICDMLLTCICVWDQIFDEIWPYQITLLSLRSVCLSMWFGIHIPNTSILASILTTKQYLLTQSMIPVCSVSMLHLEMIKSMTILLKANRKDYYQARVRWCNTWAASWALGWK